MCDDIQFSLHESMHLSGVNECGSAPLYLECVVFDLSRGSKHVLYVYEEKLSEALEA